MSTATVSLALRGSERLPESTRRRIAALAEKLGYQSHPYVSAFMSWRRNRGTLERPTIALLHAYAAEDGWRKYRSVTVREMHRGVVERLQARGYAAEQFRIGAARPVRLVEILRARGIAGLVFAPIPQADVHYDFPFADFSAVQVGTGPLGLSLPRVTHDHYQGALEAVRGCMRRGYRRPGLIIDPEHDARLQHVWRAGFEMGLAEHGLPGDATLALPENAPDLTVMKRWLKQKQPDVLITNLHQLVEKLLTEIGLMVPEKIALVSLSVPALGDRVSGIYQNGHLIGAQAVDQLASALQLHRTGVPADAITTLVNGRWNDGKTC